MSGSAAAKTDAHVHDLSPCERFHCDYEVFTLPIMVVKASLLCGSGVSRGWTCLSSLVGCVTSCLVRWGGEPWELFRNGRIGGLVGQKEGEGCEYQISNKTEWRFCFLFAVEAWVYWSSRASIQGKVSLNAIWSRELWVQLMIYCSPHSYSYL